jgi:selenocysteine lyase/cysteine desulfurase
VTLHGLADPARVAERTPTFCFTVDGHAPRAVTQHLAAIGVFCWDGEFYAPGPIRALGVTGGAVRAGLLHYSTREEIDRLADGLDQARKAFA